MRAAPPRGAGGGGESIHYGIFRSPGDGVKEASDASTAFMMTCMEWARPVRRAACCGASLNVRWAVHARELTAAVAARCGCPRLRR